MSADCNLTLWHTTDFCRTQGKMENTLLPEDGNLCNHLQKLSQFLCFLWCLWLWLINFVQVRVHRIREADRKVFKKFTLMQPLPPSKSISIFLINLSGVSYVSAFAIPLHHRPSKGSTAAVNLCNSHIFQISIYQIHQHPLIVSPYFKWLRKWLS